MEALIEISRRNCKRGEGNIPPVTECIRDDPPLPMNYWCPSCIARDAVERITKGGEGK
jgi:hypothetical protein